MKYVNLTGRRRRFALQRWEAARVCSFQASTWSPKGYEVNAVIDASVVAETARMC
jgi:hypothetical protein